LLHRLPPAPVEHVDASSIGPTPETALVTAVKFHFTVAVPVVNLAKPANHPR
jgi:hypothetical protein